MVKYFLYKFGQFCVRRLPLKCAYRLAVFISDMQYYFSPRDRKAVVANLQEILQTQKNVGWEAREVFRNFGRYLLEFFRMAKFLDAEYIKNNIEIINRQYADQVIQSKKGGIILTAHIGNWEMGGMVISMLGYPVVAVALPHKERPVNDLFNHQREMRGIKVIQSTGAIRKCIEMLKQNRLVALLADRDFGLTGEILDFLNKKVHIPKGPAVFSYKTGAPILPVFFIRREENRFCLFFEKPIFPQLSCPEEKAIPDLMRQYTALVEAKIRQYPTQWLMFRKFWAE